MLRSELAQRIADENPHLLRRDIDRIVNIVFGEIINTLACGDRVELRGFGVFSVTRLDPRPGRNPKTGAPVEVQETHVPRFRASKKLLARLNGASAEPSDAQSSDTRQA